MRSVILGSVISVLMALTMNLAVSFAEELPFTDVPESEWYYSDVKGAYETGLINGFEDHTFRPNEDMTYAQAVKLAACMNQKYMTGSVTLENGSSKWYDSYVTYAREQNIISRDYDWNAPATRAGYVEIFANALPDSALQEMNRIQDGSIPDVSMEHPQADAIYKLYRAGILTGIDSQGTFASNSYIKRSEVSAILTRMMNESDRKELTLDFQTLKELKLTINQDTVHVVWENNDAVTALKEMAGSIPVTIEMSGYGGFEQVGSLGKRLPRNDVLTTTTAGDIVLYSGNQIVLFYGSNTWSYTRLGHISDKSAQEMTELLGNGDVTITIG